LKSFFSFLEDRVRLVLDSQLLLALLLLAIVPMLGTLGFMLVEGWGMFDGLYMTIITMSTIGYGEVHPLSKAGRAFTIGFIIVGTGIVAYALTIVVEKILRPEFITRRIHQRKLRAMRHHYIICGYGRAGARIAAELRSLGKPFVVVESNEDILKTFREQNTAQQGGIAVVGDATDEAVLQEAGIDRANGLVATLDTDAANIFATLTARGLHPNLYIVARAEHASAQSKLLRAGANAVLSPQEIGAVRMTQMLLQQTTLDTFEIVTQKIALDVVVEELPVSKYAGFQGKSLETLQLPKRFNVIILAVKYADETVQFPAQADTVPDAGMTLVVAGASEEVIRLAREYA
jgi:voltage-gated potassium channel